MGVETAVQRVPQWAAARLRRGLDDDGKAGEMANGRRADTTMTRARPGSETTTAGGVKR